jgi:hypothetical protein
MKKLWWAAAAVCLLAAGSQILALPAQRLFNTFSGQAVTLRITSGRAESVLVDSGALPASGGVRESYLYHGAIGEQITRWPLVPAVGSLCLPGIIGERITAGALYAVSSAQKDENHSRATLFNVSIVVGQHWIFVESVDANAIVQCGFLKMFAHGTSRIDRLFVDGFAVSVTGAPNQIIPLADGYLVINEQLSSSDGKKRAEIIVNGLHLVLPQTAEVIVASARAGVTCQTSRGG